MLYEVVFMVPDLVRNASAKAANLTLLVEASDGEAALCLVRKAVRDALGSGTALLSIAPFNDR